MSEPTAETQAALLAELAEAKQTILFQLSRLEARDKELHDQDLKIDDLLAALESVISDTKQLGGYVTVETRNTCRAAIAAAKCETKGS